MRSASWSTYTDIKHFKSALLSRHAIGSFYPQYEARVHLLDKLLRILMADDGQHPTDPKDGGKPEEAGGSSRMGAGVAIGAGVGAAMMVATSEAYWFAVGTGIGVAIGAALSRT